MKPLSVVICIFLSLQLEAQNYNCFQTGQKNYFITARGYVRGMRIDSVRQAGSDTIYYPYRTYRMSNIAGTASVDSSGSSWLGKKITRKPNGTFLFNNLFDTVVIKTQAHTGDSWMFFNDTSVYSYIATVTAEDTMTVMGSLDSVKRITITADSGSISYPVDPVNNFQIILSKYHGFVQVFDLYTFPFHRPDQMSFNPDWHIGSSGVYFIRYLDWYLDVLLDNLGTCDLGCFHDNKPDTINSIFRLFPLHNPTNMEIYDFNAGDVYESLFMVGDGISTTFEYTLDSIFSRIATAYNISYTSSTHSMTIHIHYTPYTSDTSYSTTGFSILGVADTNRLLSTTLMPEEGNYNYILHYLQGSSIGGLCSRPDSYVFPSYGTFPTNTAMVPVYDSTVYSIGFGLSEKNHYNPVTYQSQQNIIFYHKDSSDCGIFADLTPRDRTLVSLLHPQNGIRISPNPASNYIDINSDEPFDDNTTISLYEITGRCVYANRPSDHKKTFRMETNNLPNGIYQLVLQSGQYLIKREKVSILR